MGRPHLFEIFLLNSPPFYYPGSWIEGVVQLRTKDSIKARAIRLQFQGQEHTALEQEKTPASREDRHTPIRRCRFSETNELSKAYITLWGYPKHTGESTPHIAPGSYVFPFCVQAPPVDLLPPTCDFQYESVSERNYSAYVFYRLVAYIDIPFAADIEAYRPIRILPRIPLSSIPGGKVPVELQAIKQLGCFCCIGGQVRVRARSLTPAVLLGCSIRCTAEIINNSNRKIVGIELSLTNSCVFNAVGRKAHASKIIAIAKFPVVLQRGEAFSNLCLGAAPGTVALPKNANKDTNQALAAKPFTLFVPFDVAPAFRSKFITSTYELLFRVKLEGPCVFDVQLHFSPVICTQLTNVPVNSTPRPTILNPTGQQRSAVLLQKASKGEHAVNFSFDGMDYLPAEQFDKSKQVAYPCFYDTNWDAVPASLTSYSPALMQALVAPATSAPSLTVDAIESTTPVAEPIPMPMAAPTASLAVEFLTDEMQQEPQSEPVVDAPQSLLLPEDNTIVES